MEMIHVIYLTTIVLLVAAGLWLLNQLRKVVDEKLEKEEQLDIISKRVVKLFDYANSDEKNTACELGEWEQQDGTIIKGQKLFNEAYVKPYRSNVELMYKVALDSQKMWIKLSEDDDNENEYNGLMNKAFCIELLEEYKKRALNPLEKELEKSKADLELCKIDKDMLLKSCKRRKSEVEALKKQVEQLKPKAQETETLTAKLQSAYGRIGALTQQLNRMKKEVEKEAAKVDVEKVNAEKVELPKECPEHLFEKFPDDIRQMAWEALCSLRPERAKRAYEIKDFCPLRQAFRWSKTTQGHKFWYAWNEWEIDGAYPNNMPPTDPNDPMYK